MNVESEDVRKIVLECVALNNELLPPDRQLPVALETPLLGKAALIDSLGLVNLIVGVEQALADRFAVEVTLASEKAMSQQRSPFRTVGTLADWAIEMLAEAEND